MKRHLIALVGALAVLLAFGSGAAQAQSVQGVGQTATTGQSATSNASSTQTNPTNTNISVRIFSPGETGSVAQNNTSAAGSAALNGASTAQAVSQAQSGAGEQAVGQTAGTGQSADSSATSEQTKPTNTNIDVRIDSPGGGGSVDQSNTSAAGSIAGNKATTEQGVEQQQGGDGCGCKGSGSGVQAAGQKAETGQEANSEATSHQDHPSNDNIAVRIFSPGSGGDVNQSNNSAALSAAGNLAETTQGVGQTQAGGCGCGGDHVQAVGQKAITGQLADSSASSTQKGASNSNVPVRIKSMGSDGSVEQSNTSLALSAALNAAKTTQAVEQQQSGCGCRPPKKEAGYGGGGGAGVQAVGQWAETWQGADSSATSEQFYPVNKNAPVREKSMGGGGSVAQSNTSLAGSLAANLAGTLQLVRQVQ
ncbi:MAG TPA: hypothetical protein VFM58_14510 [Solirubrobacteraceae bacterium]|nr:hypothetical protein [Solirubrobacteraceae bacterium]